MRLNRDDYRDMMVGGWTGEPEHERAVTLAQHAGIRALLADGYSVVADDTNLHPERLAELKTLATECEAEFVIFDLTGEDPAECIDRVHERAMRGGRYVPAGVILGMHRRWLATEQASTP
jgi:predicted kinase